MRKNLRHANLIIVKIGTSSLIDETGKLDPDKFKKISKDIAYLIKESSRKIIVVTSGAIAAGSEKLKVLNSTKTIPEKQALAAVGQNLLIREYEESFKPYDLSVAQVLLTKDALEARRRFINSRNTISQILKFGAIPIINENDTVSTDEIKVGDNDTLSALITNLMGADLLIILSNVEGFIKEGKIISKIDKITKDIIDTAKGSNSHLGTGGMRTKIEAAKIVNDSGIPMVIADSSKEKVLIKILEGDEIGTLFVPKALKLKSKKRWLAYGAKTMGKIFIDDGAEKAILKKGSSLLPVGVKEVNGNFCEGDIIGIFSQNNKEIGRGISNYNSEDIEKIKGLKSIEIEKMLKIAPNEEIIHRDNLVIL